MDEIKLTVSTLPGASERQTVQLVTIPPSGPLGQGELLTYSAPEGSFEVLLLRLVQSIAWNAEQTRVATEQMAADLHALRRAWKV